MCLDIRAELIEDFYCPKRLFLIIWFMLVEMEMHNSIGYLITLTVFLSN